MYSDFCLNKYYDLINTITYPFDKNTTRDVTQTQFNNKQEFFQIKYKLKDKEAKNKKTVGNGVLSFKLVEKSEKKLC